MGRLLALIGALVAGLAIAWANERLPDPAPASAPAGEFSAERAMADVRAMAAAPHPTGSPENARVRDHLLGRMAALGLNPQVQVGDGVNGPKRAPDVVIGGRVENLLGVLPGRDRAAPALLLMAHYDSVPGSPGAADDAAGTAAILEIVRALKTQGQPARDVMVLITDGEEAGLLGANAFFQRAPEARRAGLVVNLEARGSSGAAQMFQTSAENGDLIRLYAATTGQPAASSLTGFIYERMPNDTDLTESLRIGTAGINYAFIGGQFDYHSPTSTPALLDQGSLQHMGDEALALARKAAFDPALPGKAPNLAYQQVFGPLFVSYPLWGGWVVLAAAGALFALGLRTARRQEAFPWTDAARGAGAALFAVLGGVAVLQFARHATGAGFGYMDQRYLLAQVGRWELAVMLIATGFMLLAAAELARGRRLAAAVPLLAGLGCVAFAGLDWVGVVAAVVAAIAGALAFGRTVSRAGAWTGVLALGFVLAIVAQILAPPAALVLAWPLLVASLGAAATGLSTRRGPLGHIVLGTLAAVALGWTGGFAHAAFQSLDFMPLMGLPILMALLALWPVAQPADGAPPARWLGAALLVGGLAVTAIVRFDGPYTQRHPQASFVGYYVDQDAGKAWLYTPRGMRTDWSDAALKSGGGAIETHLFPSARSPASAAVAPFVTRPAPEIAFEKLPNGRVRLTVKPAADGRVLAMKLRPTSPLQLVQENSALHPHTLRAGQWTQFRWTAAQSGLALTFETRGPGKLELVYAVTSDGWPSEAKPLAKPPANVMGWDASGSTTLAGKRSYAW